MTTRTLTRDYLIVWGWLLFLMTLSLLAGWLPLHRGAVVTVMLVAALVKAVLVALHFMHLRLEAWLHDEIAYPRVFGRRMGGRPHLFVCRACTETKHARRGRREHNSIHDPFPRRRA